MFERNPTTRKHAFNGEDFSTLEILGVLSFHSLYLAGLKSRERRPLLGYDARMMWRRFCASNLEHEQWASKAWADSVAGGYVVWFKRVLNRLVKCGLVERAGHVGGYLCYAMTDTGRACAVAYTERLNTAMPIDDFFTYTKTTYQRVKNKRLENRSA